MRNKNSVISAVVLLATGSVLVIGCNKDKFTTKPQLKFKNVNSYQVKQGETLQFELEVTDVEGDIQNELTIASSIKNNPTLADTARYPMSQEIPSTKNLQATINICYVVNRTDGGCPIFTGPKTAAGSDTTTFKFWIKDKAGNVSDTISIDKPVVISL